MNTPMNAIRNALLFAALCGLGATTVHPEPVKLNEVGECKRLAPKYKAKTEHMLWDSTRVDLLNDEYAIEVDYGLNWAESIGQSLYYAQVTGLKPGVILLVKDAEKEQRFVYRLQTVAAKHGIRVWVESTTKVDE